MPGIGSKFKEITPKTWRATVQKRGNMAVRVIETGDQMTIDLMVVCFEESEAQSKTQAVTCTK